MNKIPKSILRLIKYPPQILYAIGLGPLIGKMVLLLTTTGRKSGKLRVTPLQYEDIDGVIYVCASLGKKCDWIRNIQANPQVEVKVGIRHFQGLGVIILDTGQIADFLEERLKRHPRIMRRILKAGGLEFPIQRRKLEQYAAKLSLVKIVPQEDNQVQRT